MGKRKKSSHVEFPFYEYLRQFYDENRKRITASYYPLTRKFLAFNDPHNAKGFLRPPQFEALEMYIFLKEFNANAPIASIFADWFHKRKVFEGRLDTGVAGNLFSLISSDNAADIESFKEIYKQIEQFKQKYPNYIFALTMGLGKTILMATCIFYEFLLANKFKDDPRFCHNALIFAPDKTVLQSLREVQSFDKSKVVPPEYVNWLDTNLKFYFLDESGDSLNAIDDSNFNIIISNTQKIILKEQHKTRNHTLELFEGSSSLYTAVPDDKDFEDLYGFDKPDEKTILTNQRFSKLIRLRQLGIYVDEAHHVFGTKLAADLHDMAKTTSLRYTINQIAAQLENAGTKVVACYNYTGTPYVGNTLLPEVVYAYSLRDAIENRYLKRASITGFSNIKTQTLVFVRAALKEFWKKYGNTRMENMLPKIAFFASTIEELQKDLFPAVEKVLIEMDIPTSKILINVGDEKITSNDDLRDFKSLDSPGSEKQFILLVNKGKEGWNCRSLFAIGLHREPKSKIFVLQATMRCLRQITSVQQTGLIFLSDDNVQILDKELQENFRLTVDELNKTTDESIPVDVRPVPPPIKVKLKRTRKLHELRERKQSVPPSFIITEQLLDSYKIIQKTTSMLDPLGRPLAQKDVSGLIENRQFSEFSLIAEIARYLNLSPLLVEDILSSSSPSISELLVFINNFNDILYDHLIPQFFNHLFELIEFKHDEEIELELVKIPKDKDCYTVSAKKHLIAKMHEQPYSPFVSKSFHLDNYCFDSIPEQDFFLRLLKSSKIDKIWFTGMLTHGQTDFAINYIDPESHTLRSYYPDFLVQHPDGSYTIFEIKADHQVDNAVVQAKMAYASQLATSGISYQLIPSSQVNSIPIN